MVVNISRNLVIQLINEGEDCSEEIIYALLGSLPNTVTKLKQITNVAENKINKFTPDPQEFFNVLSNTKYFDKNKTDYLIGLYHTHPFGKSTPSQRDITYGLNYKILYFIYGKKDSKLKAYRYNKNTIKKVQIHEIN